MPDTPKPIEVFFSYAHEDEPLRYELEKHLSLLYRQSLITGWHDRLVAPGTDWMQVVDEHLQRASIILLLISADFLASDYCYGIEMQRALQRHEAGQACVVPLLLRPTDWRHAPFACLQPLPSNGKPVTEWSNRDLAFVDITKGIRRVLGQWVLPGDASSLSALSGSQVPAFPFVFLSYAPTDLSLVERLKDDLLSHGIIGWVDHKTIGSESSDDEEELREAIRNASALVMVASPHTRHSRLVKEELRLAEIYQRPVYTFWMQGNLAAEVMPIGWSGLPSFDARQQHYPQAFLELLQVLEWSHAPSRVSSKYTLPHPPRNPYKGLQPFHTEDAQDFFGRDSLIEELLEKLQQFLTIQPRNEVTSRLLLVLGASGSGKSSVVMAGLIPRLKQGALPGSEQWIYLAPMVPGQRPLEALTLTLAPLFSERSLKSIREDLEDDSARGLHLLLATCVKPSNTKVLLLVDQFEELFTQTATEAERRHFLDLLLTAVAEPHGPLMVVLTLRADFYDRPLHYPELAYLIKKQQVVVFPMEMRDLRTIIEQPAQLPDVQLTFEENLVGDLLFDMQGQAGALPLLQFILDQLFQKRRGRFLTSQAYQEIGGGKGALAKHAESTYTDLLSDEHRTLARVLFLRLIDLGQTAQDTTRRRVALTELSLPHPTQTKMLREAADAFTTARLLTANTIAGSPTLEVSHEALIGEWTRLAEWLQTDRSGILLQKRITEDAAEWIRRGKPRDRLYRGSQISEAKAWAEENVPNIDEVTFIQASVAEQEREEAEKHAQQARERDLQHRAVRRQRYVIGLIGVTSLVLVVALTIGLLYQQLQAANQKLQGSFPVSVTNLNDHGPGSLREAITTASSGRVITFARNLSGGTILLTSGEIEITEDLRVNGLGVSSLAVSGADRSRVFKIDANVTVNISNITIRNGTTTDAGGCIYNGGTLILSNSTVTSCNASTDGLAGGGIYNASTLTLNDSTVSSNTARNGYGGGIYNLTTLTLNRSTVSGNTAGQNGGGIDNGYTLTLTNSTISGNHAQEGGGILIGAGGSGNIFASTIYDNTADIDGGNIHANGDALVKLYESIIAGGNANSAPDIAGTVTFFEDGYNLIQNESGATFLNPLPSNLIGVSPKLGPLESNGGPTKTHRLLPGSPAIDQVLPGGECGPGKVIITDQRDITRPQGPACDIGAYELVQ